MDTTVSSFTARNNAKRAAEKMIANGKAPAVNYGIRPRDDGRFEIVWKTAPTTGEVEAEIATAATATEDGHHNTNPRLSVNEDPSDAPPNAGAEEVAAATGNEPAASSVPASGAPERDNKWPDDDAKRAGQPRRARATEPRTASRSRYALGPAVIAAGKLPDKAPVVTSAANAHYQKPGCRKDARVAPLATA